MKLQILADEIGRLAIEYQFKVYDFDSTGVTLLCRMAISHDVFVQVYANQKKSKLNIALVLQDQRIYGVDSEGGSYHEHPFENPEQHIPIDQPVGLKQFVIKSIEILNQLELL